MNIIMNCPLLVESYETSINTNLCYKINPSFIHRRKKLRRVRLLKSKKKSHCSDIVPVAYVILKTH